MLLRNLFQIQKKYLLTAKAQKKIQNQEFKRLSITLMKQ